MQTKIHGVPLLGRVADRFQHLIPIIEIITQPSDWTGIGAVAVSDDEIPYTQDYEAGKYLIFDRDYDDGVVLTHNNGEKEPIKTLADVPYIILESGYFQDDFWFVFTLLHELGHHNDPKRPMKSTFEAEVFAHQFALTRMSGFKFERKSNDFPIPKYFVEAIQLMTR